MKTTMVTMCELLAGAAERFELTEKGLVEKVVHPAHGAMETRLVVRLVGLGVPPERIFSNTRLTPERNGRRYVPDLFVVRETNPKQPLPHEDYGGVPDLVIEILSESTEDRERDLVEKRAAYALRGVPRYWIADPDTDQILGLARSPAGEWGEETVPLASLQLPWAV